MLPTSTKALILDMDGVLWRDTQPIGDLPEIFTRIRDRGLKFTFGTNNSTKTTDEFLHTMSGFGVELEPWQIITSSLAMAEALKRNFPNGGPVFLIGENGIEQALIDSGFQPVQDPQDCARPVAVVVGFDRLCTYAKLRRATLLIRAGIPFYGTNPDKTFPTPEGLVPGAGSLLAAISAASDIQPKVIGKPSPELFCLALERMGTTPDVTLVVGDRLETDITAGQAAGCKTAVVLTGVATREQAETWNPKADFIAENLSALVG